MHVCVCVCVWWLRASIGSISIEIWGAGRGGGMGGAAESRAAEPEDEADEKNLWLWKSRLPTRVSSNCCVGIGLRAHPKQCTTHTRARTTTGRQPRARPFFSGVAIWYRSVEAPASRQHTHNRRRTIMEEAAAGQKREGEALPAGEQQPSKRPAREEGAQQAQVRWRGPVGRTLAS